MAYMDTAKAYIGTKEIFGTQDNPKIMEMYTVVGHDWVEHDEVAWCAAFVGFVLEKNGIRSTRKLNARSYINFGRKVYTPKKFGKLTNAREGDICIFSRGGKTSWQGHVTFFVKRVGEAIICLGGNQSDSVNTQKYPLTKLLAIVRPGKSTLTLSILKIQHKLKALGYHEVGIVDGEDGPRTQAAILAFRVDNNLPLETSVDSGFERALMAAKPRPVSESRRKGKPENSRILSGSNMAIGTSTVTAIGTAASEAAKNVESVENAKSLAERAANIFNLGDWLAPYWPYITIVLAVVVIVVAMKIRKARISDHQTGKTS